MSSTVPSPEEVAGRIDELAKLKSDDRNCRKMTTIKWRRLLRNDDDRQIVMVPKSSIKRFLRAALLEGVYFWCKGDNENCYTLQKLQGKYVRNALWDVLGFNEINFSIRLVSSNTDAGYIHALLTCNNFITMLNKSKWNLEVIDPSDDSQIGDGIVLRTTGDNPVKERRVIVDTSNLQTTPLRVD